MSDRLIRPAEQADVEAIVAIYNDVMQSSSTIWREEPTSVARQPGSTRFTSAGTHALAASEVARWMRRCGRGTRT
jgi:L-amino acid N-acyltransferase YncA